MARLRKRRPRPPTWRDQSTAAKGYGALHVAARKWYVARYVRGVTKCAIGHETLNQPPSKLDLAHNEARTAYLGLACWKHNRGGAAKKGNAKRKGQGGRSRGRKWA